MSKQCLETLTKISLRANGLNKTNHNQVMRDSDLKRERKTAKNESKPAKRVKESPVNFKQAIMNERTKPSFRIVSTQASKLTFEGKSGTRIGSRSNTNLLMENETDRKDDSLQTLESKTSDFVISECNNTSTPLDMNDNTKPPYDENEKTISSTHDFDPSISNNTPKMNDLSQTPKSSKETSTTVHSSLKRKREQKRIADEFINTHKNIHSAVLENLSGAIQRQPSRRNEQDTFNRKGDSNGASAFGVQLKSPLPMENTSKVPSSTDPNLTPWQVTLKKVPNNMGSSFLSPKSSVKNEQLSPWNVSLKPVSRQLDQNQCATNKCKRAEEGFEEIHLELTCSPSHSPHISRHSNKTKSAKVGSGREDIEEDTMNSSAIESSEKLTELMSGDMIDLSNLPTEIFAPKSRTQILPITNNEESGDQVIVMGGGILLIAKRREDDTTHNAANVIWYKHFDNITSFNMKTASGCTGVEIISTDSPPYPLYFRDSSLYMILVQAFLNFKNGVEDDIVDNDNSESNVDTKKPASTDESSDVRITYDENEWDTISKFRRMLQRGIPEDAVRHQLDINYEGISQKVHDAIFNGRKTDGDVITNETQVQESIVTNQQTATSAFEDDATSLMAAIRSRQGAPTEDCSNIRTEPVPFQDNATSLMAAIRSRKGSLKEEKSDTIKQPPLQNNTTSLMAAIRARNADGQELGSSDKNDSQAVKEPADVPLKDDPRFQKYFKMIKMGLPLGAAKKSMVMNQVDPTILDLDHNKSLESQQNRSDEGDSDPGVPIKDDPRFQKYFKMIKMGLPLGAAKKSMVMDQVDPTILDLDHNKSLESQKNPKKKGSKTELPKKNARRHTRVHWEPIEEVKASTIWAESSEIKIRLDESDINKNFQEEVGGKTKRKATDKKTKKKTDVQFVNRTRAQNGAIILARMKHLPLKKIVKAIDTVDESVGLSIEEIQKVKDYIPTDEELNQLRDYVKGKPEQSEVELLSELCEFEKFIFEMAKIKQQKEKASALLFKLQFSQRKAELESDITLLNKACDELKNSAKFKGILRLILEVGNLLNTAGQTGRGRANAITIESINKLSVSKGLGTGKGTTVLEFMVKNILEQRKELGEFKDEIPSVLVADKLIWSSVESTFKEIEDEVKNLYTIEGCKSVEEFKLNESLRNPDNKLAEDQSCLLILERSIQAAINNFNRLTSEYFGETGQKTPNAWFENICNFSRDFYKAKNKISDQIARQIQATARKKKASLDITNSVPRQRLFATPKPHDEELSDLLKSIQSRNPTNGLANRLPKFQADVLRTPDVRVPGCDLTSVFQRILPGNDDSLGPASNLQISETGEESSSHKSTPQNLPEHIVANNSMSTESDSNSTITTNTETKQKSPSTNRKAPKGEEDDISYSSASAGDDDDISFASHSSQRRSLAIMAHRETDL